MADPVPPRRLPGRATGAALLPAPQLAHIFPHLGVRALLEPLYLQLYAGARPAAAILFSTHTRSPPPTSPDEAAPLPAQVWQNAELVVLPAYFPSAEERANPALYALNVRRAVSEATGCRESDAYARHKFELHRHIHAGRIDWRWHRNPRSAAELEARLLTPVRPRTDGQEPGDPGKRGREAEGPAISPILPLDRTIGEVAQWDVEEGAARGEGNEAKQGGAGAAPPALTAANCRGGDGEAPTGRGGGGDAEREASVETGATCPGDATRGTVAADAE